MKKMKRFSIFFVVLALICALGLTLAYFTDYVTGDGSIATADNAVDIDITKPDDPVEPDPDDPTDPDFPVDPWVDPTPNDDTDDIENWWNALNATALANFNPGDKLCLDGKITNNGTLDIEYRETFIITTDKVMSTSSPQFRLFSNCIREEYGALTGGSVVSKETIDGSGKKITYEIAVATLAPGSSVNTNYDLVFDKAATNTYQGTVVTVDYILEACQAGGDWATIATASTKTAAGDINVVPKA